MRMQRPVTCAFVVVGLFATSRVSAQSTSARFVDQLSEVAADEGVMCGTKRFLFPNQTDQGVLCYDASCVGLCGARYLLHMTGVDRIAIGLQGSVWIIRGNQILRDVAGQAVQVGTLPEAGHVRGFELFGNPTTLTLNGMGITEWDGLIVLMGSGKAYFRSLAGASDWEQLVTPAAQFVSLSAFTDPIGHSYRVPDLVTENGQVWDYANGPGQVGTLEFLPLAGRSYAGFQSWAIGFRCYMRQYTAMDGSSVENWKRLELNESFDLEWQDLPDYGQPYTFENKLYYPPFDAYKNVSIDDQTGQVIPETFEGSMVCKPSGFDSFQGEPGKVEGFITGTEGRVYVVRASQASQALELELGTWKDPFAKMSFWSNVATPGAPQLLEVDPDGGPVYAMSSGYAEVPAASLPTFRLPVPRSALALDVFVPSSSGWAGGIQFSADVGPGALNGAYVGYQALDALPKGQWSTIQVPLPPAIQAALAQNYPASLVHTFVNAGPAGLKVRGLRFVGALPTTTRTPPDLLTPFVASTDFTGFEEPGGWSGAGAEITSVRSTDGSHAMRLNTGGYTEVISRQFATEELPAITSTLSLDIFVPSPAPNPYWTGDVQMYLSCPSAGVWSKFLGRADLAATYGNEWNSLKFAIDAPTQDVLLGSNTCQLSIAINTPTTSLPTAFFVDRLGFEVPAP
jgi:hypothetical protein